MKHNEKYLLAIKGGKVWNDFFSSSGIENSVYTSPQKFFNEIWSQFLDYENQYEKKYGKKINNSFPGRALEIITFFILDYEKIPIDSMDEEIEGVPFVKPDFIIKGKNIDFFLSSKTSLRERWKQADWESIKYKNTFPNTLCYVFTNHETEGESLKKKIHLMKEANDRLDIDKVFITHLEFDELINDIKIEGKFK